MAFELTDANFQEKVLDTKGITLVDFWAAWCGPCKAIGPIIEELASDYEGKALIAKVDVDENFELSNRFQVRSIPTILILKDGEVVDKHVGFATKQVLADKLEAQLVEA
ncbi:thioredoxin [Neolewinella lacunae]|uniref:Thioredoxin n=1 Tax=Neolewinella lacunae TaxID=1517758 RepID=A0A923PFC8_9BACT|nr:thioredoxin [Neolewinella lacunae]MBC6993060.1 thioredoxin [Neolewinella lacunae]MDN3635882.1 thioredoxin [Neolewinella lacunae]